MTGDCHRCGLRQFARFPVHGKGSPNARIVLVGEAPGHQEDQLGVPFVGPAGELLDSLIVAAGLKRDDLWVTNSYHCRPYKNDIGLAKDSPCPDIWLRLELNLLPEARVIVALGATAMNVLGLMAGEPVRNRAGKSVYFNRDFGPPLLVIGTYHPAAAVRGNVTAGRAILWSLIRAKLYVDDASNLS